MSAQYARRGTSARARTRSYRTACAMTKDYRKISSRGSGTRVFKAARRQEGRWLAGRGHVWSSWPVRERHRVCLVRRGPVKKVLPVSGRDTHQRRRHPPGIPFSFSSSCSFVNYLLILIPLKFLKRAGEREPGRFPSDIEE